MRILIVEDEYLIRVMLRDLLEEGGFECRAASDAAEAFAILDERSGWRPDLLVTDFNLGPGPNGADIAAAARQSLPNLPVIYATGNPECVSGLCFEARGEVLAKPFAGLDLITVAHAATSAGSSPPRHRVTASTGGQIVDRAIHA